MGINKWLPREALIVAGLGIVAAVAVVIIEPGVATGALASPRAVAAFLGVGAIFLGLAVLVRRVPNAALRFLILLVPVAAFAWFAVVPAFVRTTADEPFPAVAAAATPTAAAPTEPTAVAATAAETPTAAPAPATAAPTGAATPAPTAAAPAEPVAISTGALGGLTGHDASGIVSTYQLPDGSRVVRFEDVAIQPGPDYFVWLVPGADATAPEGGVELGGLTATNGSFNYDVPADFDTSQPYTVLVWCRAFSVEIASAPQISV